MEKISSVDQYINKKPHWQKELKLLRKILLSTELEETVKWGAPVYTLKGKNVIGLGAFKNHVAIWFFQGVFLKDSKSKLLNAQENKTKGLRQWRFASYEEIEDEKQAIKEYVIEAIENEKSGKSIKPQKTSTVEIPRELQQALSQDSALNDQFTSLTKAKQREYAEYIAEAKRAQTKQSRIEKIKPLILQGKSLHDKYKSK